MSQCKLNENWAQRSFHIQININTFDAGTKKKMALFAFQFCSSDFCNINGFSSNQNWLRFEMIFCSNNGTKYVLELQIQTFFWWCKMESHMASGLIHMKISTRGKLIECMDIENKSQYYKIRDTVAMGRLIKNAKKTKQITWLFYEDSPKNQIILVANRGIFALPFPWYPLIFSNFVST